jgi:hypothetical protein
VTTFTGSGIMNTLEEMWERQVEGYRREFNNAAARQFYRRVELTNLEGSGAEINWTVATTPLVLPRQIDLEAASSA